MPVVMLCIQQAFCGYELRVERGDKKGRGERKGREGEREEGIETETDTETDLPYLQEDTRV